MKKILLTLAITIVSLHSFSQTGTIEGTVKDTVSDKYLAFANVILLRNDDQISVTTTGPNGNYSLDKVVEGNYELMISYVGYPKLIIDSVQVKSNDKIKLNILFPSDCKYDNTSGICLVCNKKDKVIPIVYGHPNKGLIKKSNKGKVKLGGCNITGCDPHWYCNRDENEF